jgi:hypothetical protein
MSDDYRLREDLERILRNAGKTPHWNTVSDNLELPGTFSCAEVEAARREGRVAGLREAGDLIPCCGQCGAQDTILARAAEVEAGDE